MFLPQMQPSVCPDRVTWTSPRGERCKLKLLLPLSLSSTEYNSSLVSHFGPKVMGVISCQATESLCGRWLSAHAAADNA